MESTSKSEIDIVHSFTYDKTKLMLATIISNKSFVNSKFWLRITPATKAM